MEITAENLKIDVKSLAKLAWDAQAYCRACRSVSSGCHDCRYGILLHAVGHGIPPNKPHREVWL